MTNQEILESNKIIAEFMGGKMIVENYHGINIIKFPNGDTSDLCGLKYHTSWAWLMIVVERIESLGYYSTVNGCANSICHYCWFDEGGDGGDLPKDRIVLGYNSKNGESKIYTTWLACIEFIKWYNSQRK